MARPVRKWTPERHAIGSHVWVGFKPSNREIQQKALQNDLPKTSNVHSLGTPFPTVHFEEQPTVRTCDVIRVTECMVRLLDGDELCVPVTSPA